LVLNNLLAAEIAPEDISHPCHGFSSGPPMAVFFTLLTRCIVPESNETLSLLPLIPKDEMWITLKMVINDHLSVRI